MFLRNGWYSALWSHELTDKPVGKTFLNEKIVLFRNGRGQVGALEDRCCHRAAPLSTGELSRRNLACGYHGLKFDVNGQCVEVPGQPEVPAGAKVRSYPVHEKNNVVWIWMGDAAKADAAKIPDMPWLSDPKWATTPGRLYVKTNYQFIIDNLLDLTHVAYVHKKTHRRRPARGDDADQDRTLARRRPRRPLDDRLRAAAAVRQGGQLHQQRRPLAVRDLASAGIVYLDVGCAKHGTGAPQGDRSQGISIWSSHLVTPETETYQPLHVLLRPRLQSRRQGNVEAAVRRIEGDVHWRMSRFSRRCRATAPVARSTA